MKLALLWLMMLICLLLRAQKNDYNWLMGYDSQGNFYDSTCNCGFGITKFNFNQTPVSVTRDSLGINFNYANSIMSNSDGNLLFGCNGVRVYNNNNQLMQNGDSLGWGPLFSYFNPLQFDIGRANSQSSICLPRPGERSIYDYYYIYVDTVPWPEKLAFDKLLHAVIDVSANNGIGSVIKKDEVVFAKDINPTIAVVKHGNGRDWWIITKDVQSNCHNLILFDSMSIESISTQCLGAKSSLGNVSGYRFSQDGNTYVTTDDSGDVNVFNFDRCNGRLDIKEQFVIDEVRDSFQWWPTGLEFSPNSRFMYVFCSHRIFQYDLEANPIADSKTIIATYHFPGHHPSDYFWAQLAPDGKIYIDGGSSSFYISAIDSPDNKGSACHFIDQGIHIPTFIMGLPYNPNYRLGALPGSACDTLTGLDDNARAEKEKILKIYPNPARTTTTIDYGFTDWNKGEVVLEISNELGLIVYTQKLPMYSGFQRLDVSSFASGVYMVSIKRKGVTTSNSKLVKE